MLALGAYAPKACGTSLFCFMQNYYRKNKVGLRERVSVTPISRRTLKLN